MNALRPTPVVQLGRVAHLAQALLAGHLLFRLGQAPGETIEFIAVFVTLLTTLAILVLLGRWWENR
jgi:hypothetical protein